MKWLLAVAVAALTAIVAANVVLLVYGDNRHDPVGQLSPVANLRTTPAPLVPVPLSPQPHHNHNDDD